MAEIEGRQNGIAEEFDQINACIAEVTSKTFLSDRFSQVMHNVCQR
jgi:hypothetical protein